MEIISSRKAITANSLNLCEFLKNINDESQERLEDKSFLLEIKTYVSEKRICFRKNPLE